MKRALLLLLLPWAASGCSSSPSGDARPREGGALDGRGDGGPRREHGDLLPPDLVLAGSDRCLGGAPTTPGTGKLELQGTTAGGLNEYASSIRCGEASPLIGPQRYYRLELQQGITYRIELRPSFEAALLLALSCGANPINTDCGSQGTTGAFSGKIPAGGSGAIAFTAPASGSYPLAVDSYSTTAAGTYSITIEGFSAPANSACAKAEARTVSGKLVVEGNTLGATNEFPGQIHCGLGIELAGPQLYYKLSLAAGWYRLALAPAFPAALYLAGDAAGCKPGNLEVDCGGVTGTVLPPVPAGGKASTAFQAPVSGSYIVAVDSPDPKAAGSFSLEVEPYTPPANMICGAATPLSLVGGVTSATGSTATHLNDLGAQVRCGTGAPLLGPQAYFKADLKAIPYQLLLKPDFAAVLAVGQSCQTIPADCGSGGLSGTSLEVAAGKTGATVFKPAVAGTYLIAVDSTGGSGGPFTLEVKEHTPPTYGVCSQPKALALSTGTALEAGDTTPLKNDLAGVSCGVSGVTAFAGPQAYYRLAVQGGKSYQVELQPEPSFDPALYAFPASTTCTGATVSAACTGTASDKLGAGVKESLLLTPAASGEMILVVDSWSVSEVGSYTLSVVEK